LIKENREAQKTAEKIFRSLLIRELIQFYIADYILSCHLIINIISALSMITSTNKNLYDEMYFVHVPDSQKR